MAKYLTEFDTYAQYSGATLSLPNVSLIKNTGEVYYKNLFAGDTFGDVLMYDIANDKLVSSFGGIWDSTTYPIASYTPIAVNVYPASQTPDGKNRYLAVRWADGTSEGKNTMQNGVASRYYGPDDFVPSTDQNAFNGRANQDAAEALMPGTTGNTQAEYSAFYACSVFAPTGTSAGDWYLPSLKELSLYKDNYSTINDIFQSIKTAAGSSYLYTAYASIMSSTTANSLKNYHYFNISYPSNNYIQEKSVYLTLRAMISI